MPGRYLVVDSGVGGLSVAREIRRRDPAATICYVADDAMFPYGGREDGELSAHVVALVARHVARVRPHVAVIACNTASTLVLPPLRARLAIPVVGTVPGVKPAANRTRTGVIAVLATPGTIARDYTRALIADHAPDRRVVLVATDRLAALAEAAMRGEAVDQAAVAAEIAPAFVEDGAKRTDTAVLGCTHYVFLLEMLRRVAPWPVAWIDTAPAIARRAVSLAPAGGEASGGGEAVATSGRALPPALAPLLADIALVPAAAV